MPKRETITVSARLPLQLVRELDKLIDPPGIRNRTELIIFALKSFVYLASAKKGKPS